MDEVRRDVPLEDGVRGSIELVVKEEAEDATRGNIRGCHKVTSFINNDQQQFILIHFTTMGDSWYTNPMRWWPRLSLGLYTITLRAKRNVVLGSPADAQGAADALKDLAARLESLAEGLPEVFVHADPAGEVVIITMSISEKESQREAVRDVMDVVSAGRVTELEIQHDARSGSREETTPKATTAVLYHLHSPTIRRLRVPSLVSLDFAVMRGSPRDPRPPPMCERLETILITRPVRPIGSLQADVERAAGRFGGHRPLRSICWQDQPAHLASYCTCWDALDVECDSQIASIKLNALRETMRARQQAVKASAITALNVITLIDSPSPFPLEVWHLVWSFAAEDVLTAGKFARAVELGRGVARLDKRVAAMRHLDGEDFNGALEEWLAEEGFMGVHDPRLDADGGGVPAARST